jgi:non-heme chloroperoxidase
VLGHLAIDRFAILAISAGGAYAAQLAAQVPERVISLHAAAAVSSTLPTRTPPTAP